MTQIPVWNVQSTVKTDSFWTGSHTPHVSPLQLKETKLKTY